jgi:hypothetical protein
MLEVISKTQTMISTQQKGKSREFACPKSLYHTDSSKRPSKHQKKNKNIRTHQPSSSVDEHSVTSESESESSFSAPSVESCEGRLPQQQGLELLGGATAATPHHRKMRRVEGPSITAVPLRHKKNSIKRKATHSSSSCGSSTNEADGLEISSRNNWKDSMLVSAALKGGIEAQHNDDDDNDTEIEESDDNEDILPPMGKRVKLGADGLKVASRSSASGFSSLIGSRAAKVSIKRSHIPIFCLSFLFSLIHTLIINNHKTVCTRRACGDANHIIWK